jgi:hypothetical protein
VVATQLSLGSHRVNQPLRRRCLIRIIKKDLNFMKATAEEEEGMDEDYDE